MAPLPEESTARLFIEYTSAGQEHNMLLRLAAGATLGDAIATYEEVTAILAPQVDDQDRFTGARWAVAGSTVTQPLNVLPVTGTFAGPTQENDRPNFLSWTGRSVGGRRTRVTLFAWGLAEVGDFRIGAPLPGVYGQFLQFLQTWTPAIVAIDGQPPIWNNYVNVGVNAYYQRKIRRTG